MGGLKDKMPITLVCYCIGGLALAGLPPGFSGFFSKDELLLDAYLFQGVGLAGWSARLPFICGILGALLTAFYMARQIKYIFFGKARGHGAEHAKESSIFMTLPLIVLAILTVFTGFLNIPGSHKFHFFLSTLSPHHFDWKIMAGSVIAVLITVFFGLKLYSGRVLETGASDPVEQSFPTLFRVLHNKYYVDEFYQKTFVALIAAGSRIGALFDRWVIHGLFVLGSSSVVYVLSLINQIIDEICINKGFDKGCSTVHRGATLNRWIQNGISQHYLKLTCACIVILFFLTLFLGIS
jgi:NADH-quinone oxidoreductase subunit L